MGYREQQALISESFQSNGKTGEQADKWGLIQTDGWLVHQVVWNKLLMGHNHSGLSHFLLAQ